MQRRFPPIDIVRRRRRRRRESPTIGITEGSGTLCLRKPFRRLESGRGLVAGATARRFGGSASQSRPRPRASSTPLRLRSGFGLQDNLKKFGMTSTRTPDATVGPGAVRWPRPRPGTDSAASSPCGTRRGSLPPFLELLERVALIPLTGGDALLPKTTLHKGARCSLQPVVTVAG